jgi:hypothetical protein
VRTRLHYQNGSDSGRKTRVLPALSSPTKNLLLQEADENSDTMSAMALTAGQTAPYFPPASYATQHQIPGDIDLEGGTITHIEEVCFLIKIYTSLFVYIKSSQVKVECCRLKKSIQPIIAKSTSLAITSFRPTEPKRVQ